MMQPNEHDDHSSGEFRTSHIKRLSSKLKRRGSITDILSTGTNTTWNKMSKLFISSLKDETDNPEPKKMSKRKSKNPRARIRRTHSMTVATTTTPKKHGEKERPSGSTRDVCRNSFVPKSILKKIDNSVKA